MNSIELMQMTCYAAGVERPETFTNLNPDQKRVLQALDDAQDEMSAMEDWYFLQRIFMHRTIRYHDDVIDSDTVDVSSLGVVTFGSGILTANVDPTLNIDYANTADARRNDKLRGDYLTSLTVQILGPWTRGALTNVTYRYGVDEIKMDANIDKLCWVTVDRYDHSGGGIRHRVLTPASYEEITEVRARRVAAGYNYIHPGQPTRYCVAQNLGDSSGRTIMVDPFPDANCVLTYGAKKHVSKISSLSSTSQVDWPDKWHLALVDGALLKFLGNAGQGIPANSRAGRDAPERLRMIQEDYIEQVTEMRNWQRKGQEVFRMSPNTEDRIYFQEQLRRAY